MTYTVVSHLGQGGFGIVEEVRNNAGHHFARKTLNGAVAALHGVPMDQLKKRFTREVKQQSAFAHPNIVRIIEHDLNVDPPYFIMELANGSLEKEIAVDRTLGGNPSQALFDILSGLEAMHDLGFTHRDLKPGNVLYFANGATKRYALSDFGLITGTNSQTTTLTATGAGGGSLYYAAPECVNNFHRATNKSDIYSFGAVLHDIFGNGNTRIPYSRLTVADPNIKPIIEKCTEGNPHRRYQTVTQLRAELYNALNNQIINFTSQEEHALVDILNGTLTLSGEQWDRVCICLEQNESNDVSNRNIFRALKAEHLINLLNDSVPIFHAIGTMYCEFVLDNEGVFDFGYCDVLANILQEFFVHGDVGLKSKALISLMSLGASHNRWYVERAFWGIITNPDLPPNVVQRFLIDVEVLELNLKRYIEHILRSITVTVDQLPASIQAALVLAS